MTNCPTAIELVGRRCTGCETCTEICPQKALRMEMDSEGFFYPRVDGSLCTHCGLCTKRCPVASPDTVVRHQLPIAGYAGGHQSKQVRLSSASGGAFSAVVAAANADAIYGAAWARADCVEHLRVTPQDITPLRTSKYVQSSIGNAYQMVKQDLAAGLRVVFSGTPCQVAGLLSYLGEPSDHLFTIEILCHGVASPGLFREYLQQLSSKMGSQVTAYSFRTKNDILGWWEDFHTEIRFENGLIHRDFSDPFTRLFLAKYILRPSCESCEFSGEHAHAADVILGDYWGCSMFDPELYDRRGVSVLIPLTQKGRELVDGAKEFMNIREVPLAHMAARNQVLLCHKAHPPQRDAFFQTVADRGLGTAIQSFSQKPNWKVKMKPYFRLFLKKLRG